MDRFETFSLQRIISRRKVLEFRFAWQCWPTLSSASQSMPFEAGLPSSPARPLLSPLLRPTEASRNHPKTQATIPTATNMQHIHTYMSAHGWQTSTTGSIAVQLLLVFELRIFRPNKHPRCDSRATNLPETLACPERWQPPAN